MIILTLRTDKPEAEIGLYQDHKQLAYEVWEANRQLAATLHQKLRALLDGHSKDFSDVGGIVCFKGPGSFTGLRIGLTVGNALAYSNDIPIVATRDPEWLESGIQRLLRSESDVNTVPFYGAEAHITQQKK